MNPPTVIATAAAVLALFAFRWAARAVGDEESPSVNSPSSIAAPTATRDARPPIDRDAPSVTKTATFALG